jgi:manganese/zinc/iron transport system ATP- binding protein
MNEPKSALQVNQLNVSYDKTPVLWDISLNIPSGTLTAIVGPNGAGKSTFIKAALGLITPISGKIEFFGESLKQQRLRIGYVPQRESVDWDFPITVRDLVLMGRYGKLGLFKRVRDADWMAVEHYLNAVGMLPYADRQISQLSLGQQQRVFLARALAQEADLYFMDEPFAGVDQSTEAVIVNLLKQLQKNGKTVFVVHHDLNTVTSYFDWIIMLNMILVSYGPMSTAYNEETVNRTYGKGCALFEKAIKLSQQHHIGEK